MPQAEGVHELKDILVEEVSLVDHPANKRRFLLVKRNNSMTQLVPNGRGSFTAKADDTDKPGKKPDDEDAEKAGKKPPPFPPPKGESDDKGKATKADVSGQALAAEIREHIDALEELADALDDEEEEEPGDVHMNKLGAVHKAMGAMVDKYMSKRQKKRLEKVGRKMSAARQEIFEKAVNSLMTVLGELLDTPSKQKSHDPDAGDPQAKPAGWSAANPSDAPSGDAGTAGGWRGGKNDDAAERAELAKANTKIEELERTVARLKRGTSASSNSIPVERTTTNKSNRDVSWPLDMNRPNDRASVDKSMSFFDD